MEDKTSPEKDSNQKRRTWPGRGAHPGSGAHWREDVPDPRPHMPPKYGGEASKKERGARREEAVAHQNRISVREYAKRSQSFGEENYWLGGTTPQLYQKRVRCAEETLQKVAGGKGSFGRGEQKKNRLER